VDTTTTEIDTIIEISELTLSAATTETSAQLEPDPMEEPYYRPDEILFTFVDTTSRPVPDGPRVQELLRRIRDIAGIELEPIMPAKGGRTDGPAPHLAGTPLTMRFRAARQDGGKSTRDHIKDAVDAVNSSLHALEHEGILVSSASPNWLTTSSGWGHPIGGPATMPEPAPAGSWPIAVPTGAGWPAGQSGPAGKVIVAVLDTSPGSAALTQAAQMARNQGNALMQDLATHNVIVDWTKFDAPDGIDTTRSPVESDHGLFVSGIVHRIAPHAEIHLLHVLDDAGIGHTHLLLDALDYCLALTHAGQRVVVNMSMYLTIPPGERVWDHWFGGPGAMPPIHPSRQAALIEALDEAVEQRIDLLLDAGAVIVAAAGNDALRSRRKSADGTHPQPRLPADYDGVICVVATNREGKISAYSNRADVPATGNCVATYGGEGVLDGKSATVPPGNPRDGMVSVYTNVEVPTVDGMQPNMTGWVYWSGTSFATPVISGIAANVLAANELARQADPSVARLTPRQVLTRILDTAAPPAETDPALGCPYLPVTLSQ
jgi:hypothetical protein